MTEPSSNQTHFGGGGPLAVLTLGGTIVGGLLGQPSIGFLAGFGLGAVVAIVIWRMGSR